MSDKINHLYPCPFCNESNTDLVRDEDGRMKLICRKCGQVWDSPAQYYEQKQALYKLAEWNRKATPHERPSKQ